MARTTDLYGMLTEVKEFKRTICLHVKNETSFSCKIVSVEDDCCVLRKVVKGLERLNPTDRWLFVKIPISSILYFEDTKN